MGCSNSTMQSATTPRSILVLPEDKPKYLAFQIDFRNNESKELNKDIDKILSRPLPKRLQRLEPLPGASKLTAEALEKRQEIAEIKRQKAHENLLKFARKQSARHSIVIGNHENIASSDKNSIQKDPEKIEKSNLKSAQNFDERHQINVENFQKDQQNSWNKNLELNFNKVDVADSSSIGSWSDSGDEAKSRKLPVQSSVNSSGYNSRKNSTNKDKLSNNILKEFNEKSEKWKENT